jgi:hypothetical protein
MDCSVWDGKHHTPGIIFRAGGYSYMSLDCVRLMSLAPSIPLVQACDTIKNGAIRIQTPFFYPDGSSIDLFLDDQPGNLIDPEDTYTLSDLGQTASYLLNQQITYTERRKQILEDICRTLSVGASEGVLRVFIEKASFAESISDAINRLGQACVRASDLEFIQRSNSGVSLKDEVSGMLTTLGIPRKVTPKLRGRYGKLVRLDFEIYGKHKNSLLQTLNARTKVAFHTASNEAFTKWHDLDDFRSSRLFFTVIRLSEHVRDEDLNRLHEYSEIIYYPEDRKKLLALQDK